MTTASRPPSSRDWPRAAIVGLAVLLAIHAALIAFGIARLFPESPYNPVDESALRQIGLPAAAVFLLVAFAQRQRPALGVLAVTGVLAIVVFLPAPMLTALFVLGGAWGIGDAILRSVERPLSVERPGGALAVLTGLAVLIAAQSALAPFPVHTVGVYAAVLAAGVALGVPGLPAAIERWGVQRRAAPPFSVTDRAWLALLGVVAAFHLVVLAKPEVGFDAQTMHLQFARMVAARHAFPHDVTRYAWAVMPLGADWVFAMGQVLDGETCARLLNFAGGAIACRLLYQLAGDSPARWPALATATLLASAPLSFLVTGTLFSEALWCAFSLGTLVAAEQWLRTRSGAALCALYFTAAGALQCKAISLAWLAPLAVLLIVRSRTAVLRPPGWRLRAGLAAALVAGAWPYAEAWWRTGNPLFPFMNGLFRSPLFDTARSFNNPSFNAALRPWTLHALVLDSGRFLEGAPGAPGFHWLLLIPLMAIAFVVRRPTRTEAGWLALGAAFFVLVFVQQSYLRYLLPALLVGAAAGGWALQRLPTGTTVRTIVLALGCVLVAINLRFMYTASWFNADICRHCAFDAGTRNEYVARYAPLRRVTDFLDQQAPNARVGYLLLGPTPAGFTGYSRAWSWHDPTVYQALTDARNAEDVLAIVRRFNLTHVVVRVVPGELEEAMAAFRDRYTKPMWESGNYRVAVVVPPEAAR